MTYKAYLDNVFAKTGKTAEDYRKMAAKTGLTKYADLLRWLKTEEGLGHGHANAIILYIRDQEGAKQKLKEEAKAGK